jgi:hypothetical protein
MARSARSFLLTWSSWAVMATMLLGGCTSDTADDGGGGRGEPEVTQSSYDAAVLADEPVGYWTSAEDRSGNGHDGEFSGGPDEVTMPNGDSAPLYDVEQYLTIPDASELSVATTGALTVEAWLRPSTLQFSDVEDDDHDYVHWLGKGTDGDQEYAARMYSLDNSEDRPNRISGYVFNRRGGEGAGSNFEDRVATDEWIHFALTINTDDSDPDFPTGYVQVYKNGELRDKDALEDYDIVPEPGPEPLRVGTRDFKSFFEGAIGKVAVYDREVTGEQLLQHHRAMVD